MGWGCHRHEFDINSEEGRSWKTRCLGDGRIRAFGRDNEVCPRCFLDVESALLAAQRAMEALAKCIPEDRLADSVPALEQAEFVEELIRGLIDARVLVARKEAK